MPFNSIFAWLIKKRLHQIDLFKKYPVEVQNELLFKLLERGKKTEYGKKYHFDAIQSYNDFKNQVPLQDYEALKPWVDRLMKGEQNLLWDTETKWFAKSSGTTSDRSKLIPVTRESLEECHYKGGKDLLALYYNNHPNTKLYKGKHLIVGGSAQINNLSADSYFGDLSAIIVKNLPWWAEIRRTPAKEIALMSEWESKIERMAAETISEDVHIMAGVPSWTLILANKVLEISGKKNLKEVWPNLELFMHGGVSFDPYRDHFNNLIPGNGMNYVQTYNASEGFFGIQDEVVSDEMLLMLDYGIFFEFIPLSSYDGTESKEVISIQDVQKDVNYALVISTNGGLWRYILGDTVKFTSLDPCRIQITGRTNSYINVFGEELIVDNADKAITEACRRTNAKIREYTACPVHMTKDSAGAHEWVVEFHENPDDHERFVSVLDEHLRQNNSDYDAKRYRNMILDRPIVHFVKAGTFDDWLKTKHKLGGQNKIPRLSNDRSFVEQILHLQKENKIDDPIV